MGATKTWLVANAASGSHSENSLRALTRALAKAGHKIARVIAMPDEPAPTRGELEAAGVGLLAVFGGDGTAGAAIAAVAHWRGVVLVLPGGTANLLARALHGELDSPAIVARLADGALAQVRRNGIACSAGLATIEVLAGPGATWSDVREDLRTGDPVKTAGSVITATRQSTAGAPVHIVDPPLGRTEGYPGVRLSPTGTRFEVCGYGPQTVIDYVKQGVALLRRDFRDGPHDELGRARSLVCRSSDGAPIELMLDGERVTGRSEERFLAAPLQVNLLAARHG